MRLPVLLLLCCLYAIAARADTIPSGVYRWQSAIVATAGTAAAKLLPPGQSRHLDHFQVLVISLPAQQAMPSLQDSSMDQLLIVKRGQLALTLGDSSGVLDSAGMAFIPAGERHSFQNAAADPVGFYIIQLRPRQWSFKQTPQMSGRGFIKNWRDLKALITTKGESRAIFDQPTDLFSRFDAHATALKPGMMSHDPHTHAAEEIILVINGNVTERIGQSSHTATAGDVIYLAGDVLHNITNTGTTQCNYFAIQWRTHQGIN